MTRLRQLHGTWRRALRARPDRGDDRAVDLSPSPPGPSPAALRIVNFAVGLLREAGYSGEDAYRAFTALTFQSAGRYIISANSNRHTPERRSILPPNASREEYPALADIADPAVADRYPFELP